MRPVKSSKLVIPPRPPWIKQYGGRGGRLVGQSFPPFPILSVERGLRASRQSARQSKRFLDDFLAIALATSSILYSQPLDLPWPKRGMPPISSPNILSRRRENHSLAGAPPSLSSGLPRARGEEVLMEEKGEQLHISPLDSHPPQKRVSGRSEETPPSLIKT